MGQGNREIFHAASFEPILAHSSGRAKGAGHKLGCNQNARPVTPFGQEDTLRHLLSSGLVIVALSGAARADKIDDVVRAELEKRKVPGLSLAIIQDGKIVKVKAYGVTELGGTSAVTPTTLFQAGSISKPVAAMGALALVRRGKLDLDEDVNVKLKTWKIPASDAAKDKKVTLRRLLSHSAGLTVHGFPGYASGEPMPTLVQILDGEKPANTPSPATSSSISPRRGSSPTSISSTIRIRS